MEKTIFYFRQNSTILHYAPILIIGLCLFWSVYDIVTADSMYFIATGAIYAILAMTIMAGIDFFYVTRTEKVLDSVCSESELEKDLETCEFITFLQFLVLVFASVLILASNNYDIYLSGINRTMQTISLSSALLFIPVVMPLPEKRYGFALFAASILSLGFPYLLPGRECYAILPELVLRIAIAIAYLVVWQTTEKSFQLEQKIKNGNTKILTMLVNLIELRDLESGEHVSKVQDYTRILFRKLNQQHPEYGFTYTMEKNIVEASSMHDIGKLMIPDQILCKPGKLTAEEFEVMKTHTLKGKEILENLPEEIIGKDFLRYSIDICEYHHEKYDGKGYPEGLCGEQIPIWSQLVSIVDCYEALTSERHYKGAFSHEKAVEMIRNGECGAFSPVIMECFLSCEEELRECLEHNDSPTLKS